MIRRIRVENFRSHGKTDVPLQPLSVLVGPAGAGKSNLLKALVFLQNTIRQPMAELFPPSSPWSFRMVRSRWADETDPIGFSVELDEIGGWSAAYALRFADSPDGIYVLEETLQKKRPEDPEWQWVFQRRWPGTVDLGAFGTVQPRDPTVLNKVWFGGKPGEGPEGPRFARDVAKALWSVGYFHFEASRLRALSDDREYDRIGYGGQDLPGFLAALQRNEPARFARVVDGMKELLPALDGLRITRVGPDQQGLAMTFHGQVGFTNAPDLSDGTLFTLGLLAITNMRKPPRLLCIEEPETGLHPRRLRWLFERFVDLAFPTADPQRAPIQVLLTTHSPYLLDLFKDMPEAVSVVEQDEGRTKVTNLVEAKQKLHDTTNGDPIGHEWASGLFEGL